MRDNNITLDEMLIAMCIHINDLQLLNEYFSKHSAEQKIVFFQRLTRKGILSYVNPLAPVSSSFNQADYALSTTYSQLCMNILANTLLLKVAVNNVEEQDATEKLSFYDTFLEKFRDSFPQGIRNGGNLYLRGNKEDIQKKMNKFLTKYKYNFETILTATKNFLHKFEYKNDYTYCPTAEYFILKDNKSTLATECEAIMSEEVSRESEGEKFDGFTHQLM